MSPFAMIPQPARPSIYRGSSWVLEEFAVWSRVDTVVVSPPGLRFRHMVSLAWFGFLLASGLSATCTAQQPAQNPPPPAITVTTIDDKDFPGPQFELAEGKLVVKSDPPQSVPFNELQRVKFVRETKLALEWIGQTPQDVAQIGALEGGNGIGDVRIRASGLGNRELRQVSIVCRPQFRVWRKDINGSPFWRVVSVRQGLSSVADLYFEPPKADLFEQELEVTLTFDDNQSAKATVKAASHTSDSATIATLAESQVGETTRPCSVRLFGGDRTYGRIIAGPAESLTLETSWQRSWSLPLEQLHGLVFDGIKAEFRDRFETLSNRRESEDHVLVLSKDGALTDIAGRITAINNASIKLVYQEQEKSIKLDRVQGVVLAHPQANPKWNGPFQTFQMASGDQLSGKLVAIEEQLLKFEPAWGGVLELPRSAIEEIRGRNTKMMNLSELTPVSVEQTAYFDRLLPFLRDKAWNSRPLKVAGRTYQRGLATHSKTILIYDLGGEYAAFRALVGFDEEGGDRGRVALKILGDERELLKNPDFRATDKPLTLDLPIKGVQQLRIEVDFGEDEDVGDRLIWANARLYRE